MIGGQFFPGNGNVPVDAHENVVKVMGDPAGQCADTLQLLHFLQIFFYPGFISHIPKYKHHPFCLPSRIPDGSRRQGYLITYAFF